MLDANLRRPAPQIPRVGKRRNRKRGQGCWSEWRKKQRVLSGHNRGMFPIKTNCAGAQSHYAERHPVWKFRKSSGEIKFHVRASACAGNVRTKSFDADLRLTQRS